MTDKEKAEYFDEWHEYFEPLARIRREVKAVYGYYVIDGFEVNIDDFIYDSEVEPEIKNLIRTMLIEIEESDD